jgi:hypothetical protein
MLGLWCAGEGSGYAFWVELWATGLTWCFTLWGVRVSVWLRMNVRVLVRQVAMHWSGRVATPCVKCCIDAEIATRGCRGRQLELRHVGRCPWCARCRAFDTRCCVDAVCVDTVIALGIQQSTCLCVCVCLDRVVFVSVCIVEAAGQQGLHVSLLEDFRVFTLIQTPAAMRARLFEASRLPTELI